MRHSCPAQARPTRRRGSGASCFAPTAHPSLHPDIKFVVRCKLPAKRRQDWAHCRSLQPTRGDSGNRIGAAIFTSPRLRGEVDRAERGRGRGGGEGGGGGGGGGTLRESALAARAPHPDPLPARAGRGRRDAVPV